MNTYLNKWYLKQGSIESVASTYESKRLGSRFFFQRRFSQVCHYLKNIREKNVLEAGSGVGYYTSFLTLRCKKVTACDISKSYIESAKNYVSKHGDINKVRFCKTSIEKMPFEDKSFDVILCSETIEHLEKPYGAVDELLRVLKSNGRLVISFPNPHSVDELYMKLYGLVFFNDHISSISPKDFEKKMKLKKMKIIGKRHAVFGYYIFSMILNIFPFLIKPFWFLEKSVSEIPILRNLCWSVIYNLKKNED